MKTLTAEWLDKQDACPASLDRFRRLFGEECQITPANVERWLDTHGELCTKDGARWDIGWLVLRLVGKRKEGYFGFFSLPLASVILQHLGIHARIDKAYHVMRAMTWLPKRRLTRAIKQIAERSPNI